MKVKCEIDTLTGEMSTTADGKHIDHDEFSMGSYFFSEHGEPDPFSEGYFSYSKKMEDGTVKSHTGHIKANKPETYESMESKNNLAAKIVLFVKSAFLYDQVKEIFNKK